MSNLNETEKGLYDLLNILPYMETIDFKETEIKINHGGKEYTVTLTKKSVDCGGADINIKHHTQINIKCPNEGNITLERIYRHNVVRGATGDDIRWIEYKVKEILPNGETIRRTGWGDDAEEALKSLTVFIERKVKESSKKVILVRENSDTEKIELSARTYRKNGNIISVTADKLDNPYFYDTETNQWYLESTKGRISFEEVNKKLAAVETSLTKVNKTLTKANKTFALMGMPEIETVSQTWFDSIAKKKEEIQKMQGYIQDAIADEYFPEDQQWTNFSEDTLTTIHGAIVERLADIETENKYRSVKAVIDGFTPDELQYVKKYLGSQQS